MARDPDANPLAYIPLRYLTLPRDVSWELFLDPRPITRWALLSKRGEFMYVQDGVNGTPSKLQFSSWPDAMMGAEQHGAEYIANFKSRRVLFRIMSPSNTPMWWGVQVLNGHESLEVINHSQADRHEPLPDGRQPKRKHPSGAQKRKLYGTPPSRKR